MALRAGQVPLSVPAVRVWLLAQAEYSARAFVSLSIDLKGCSFDRRDLAVGMMTRRAGRVYVATWGAEEVETPSWACDGRAEVGGFNVSCLYEGWIVGNGYRNAKREGTSHRRLTTAEWSDVGVSSVFVD